MTSSVSRLAMSEILNALVIMSADTPASADEYADVWISAAPSAASPLASGPAGQPPPLDPVGWGRSNSIMFLLYMVIGFSVTLGCILAALSCYYLVRYFYPLWDFIGTQVVIPSHSSTNKYMCFLFMLRHAVIFEENATS